MTEPVEMDRPSEDVDDLAEDDECVEDDGEYCASCGLPAEECGELHECESDGELRCEDCAFQCKFCELWYPTDELHTDDYNDEGYCESCADHVCDECGGFDGCDDECWCDSCRESAYEMSINEGYL